MNTIAASIAEEADTIEEVYEPYLIQLGFSIGRRAAASARPARSNISRFHRRARAACRATCFENRVSCAWF